MSNKPNLILLPGALGVSQSFKSLVHVLEQNFIIYTLDYPGHAFTKITDTYTIPELAAFVKSFIDERKLKGLHCFGYSMGGYIALYLESHHPGLFLSITTLGTKLNWNRETVAREIRFLDPEKTKEKVPSFAAYLAQLHGEDKWENLMHKTAEMMIHLCENALGEEHFRVINTRVVFLLGEKDTMVSKEETQRTKDCISNAQFHILKDTEHAFEKVKPTSIVPYLLSLIE